MAFGTNFGFYLAGNIFGEQTATSQRQRNVACRRRFLQAYRGLAAAETSPSARARAR